MTIKTFRLPKYVPIYSRTPGICGPLGSQYVVSLFPTAFEVFRITDQERILEARYSFPDLHEISDWQVCFDGVNQIIHVEGRSKAIFFRYHITAQPTITCWSKYPIRMVYNTRELLLSEVQAPPRRENHLPRLLLGVHKTPLWSRMYERAAMDEIAPYIYGVYDTVDLPVPSTTVLSRFVEAVLHKERDCIVPALKNIWLAATEHIFVPKKYDSLFLGYDCPLMEEQTSLCHVMAIISTALRLCFIREAESLEILPSLPSQWPAGRLLQESVAGHFFDIEWRKGSLRRLVITPTCDATITLSTQWNTGWARSLRKGQRARAISLHEPIALQKGEQILVDKFSN